VSDAVTRLESPDPAVRRVAIHDLKGDPEADRLLLARLPRERDEKTALLMIRRLASVPEAKPVLLALYRDRATPVRVAHAAILAHDALTGSPR
jgi:hypothetical protein